MRSVQIRGRLGGDSELKYLQSGTAVCSFSVAVNEKRGKGDEAATETHWFRCNAWAQAAERLHPKLKKGAFVSIHGKLESRSWKDKDNKPHSAVEVNCWIVDVLPPFEDQQPGAGAPNAGDEIPF